MSQYKILYCDSGLGTLGARQGLLGAQAGARRAAGCVGGALGRQARGRERAYGHERAPGARADA